MVLDSELRPYEGGHPGDIVYYYYFPMYQGMASASPSSMRCVGA